MPYIDGLPTTTTLAPTDLLVACQGSTGAPGTGVDRSVPVSVFQGAVSGVSTFNARTGAVTLQAADVNTALGYSVSTAMQPVVSSASIASALKALSIATPGNPFGFPAFEVHAVGNENGIIGSVVNDFPPSSALFPTGVTGYAKVAAGATGNSAWGSFGRADLYDKGVALNEMNSFNFSGHAGTPATPPDLGVGTSGYYPIAMLLAAYGTSSSAIGLYIAYGAEQAFETGIYMHPNSYNTTGLFIDAFNGGSTAIPALIRGSGVKPILSLQSMNTPGAVPANAVFEVQNATGVVTSVINQAGDFQNAGFNLSATGTLTFLSAIAATSATAGSAGALPALPFRYITVSLNGTTCKIPAYNV